MIKVARYGLVRDLPDHNDLLFSGSLDAELPRQVDMRPQMPPVYDQGQLGSCTGNACAAALAYARRMQGLPDIAPSRLMLYYDARALENSVGSDSGAQIRDVVKGAAARGACPEDVWPYDEKMFAAEPSAEAQAAGLKERAVGYRRVKQDLAHVRACLAGLDPIILGIACYSSFESDEVAATGIVPMPKDGEQAMGGHCVLLVGYDDDKEQVLVRNSWGEEWGLGGYFWLPYDYVGSPDLSCDLWTIRLVTP